MTERWHFRPMKPEPVMTASVPPVPTPTPRTDCEAFGVIGTTWQNSYEVMTVHARTLEQELNQLTASSRALVETIAAIRAVNVDEHGQIGDQAIENLIATCSEFATLPPTLHSQAGEERP